MSAPKLSPWLPGLWRPGLPGVYQRRYMSDPDAVYYARWDGACWYMTAPTPERAQCVKTTSNFANLPWRGLAEAPR